MNFANIRNNEIIDMNSKYLDADIVRVEVSDEIYQAYVEDRNKVIYLDGEIILNPNYEAEQAQKERERINNLTCTKRVFALMLQEVGVDYITVLKPLIESNPQAQLEWDLCVELQRGNPLLDIMASQLNITSEHLDLIFKYANGELTIEEFKLAIAPKVEPKQPVEEIEDGNIENTTV
jgi:hypothetical protein